MCAICVCLLFTRMCISEPRLYHSPMLSMTVAFSLFLAHSCIPFYPAYLSYLRNPLCVVFILYILLLLLYIYIRIVHFFSVSLNSQQTLCCTIKFRNKTCNVAQGNRQRKFNPFNYMAILYVWHALDRDCTQFEMCCLRICQPHFSFSSLTGKLKQKKYVQMVFACSFRTHSLSFIPLDFSGSFLLPFILRQCLGPSNHSWS